MAELYDAEGNLIEGALTADEVKAIQEKANTASTELAEIKEKLSKLENKDMNFKKMRDMTQGEVDKLSSKEIELMKRQEKLEEEQKSFVQTQVTTAKNEALAVLAGEDEEMRKKTLFHYDRIKDDAISREDIQRKMRDAYRLARADASGGVDPFAQAMNYSGNAPAHKKDDGGITGELKDLAKKLSISEEDLKKFS